MLCVAYTIFKRKSRKNNVEIALKIFTVFSWVCNVQCKRLSEKDSGFDMDFGIEMDLELDFEFGMELEVVLGMERGGHYNYF